MSQSLVDDDLLKALYETALHEGDWAPALSLTANRLGCAEICLTAVDRGDFATYETTGRMLSDEARDRYSAHYGALDPKMRVNSW